MEEDESLEEIETLKSFELVHKLMMCCSPIFIGASNVIFVTLNQQAISTKNEIVELSVISKFLIVEQIASTVSMLFAIAADSFAARYNLMKFTVLFTTMPVIFMAFSDPSFGNIISKETQEIFHLSGVAMISIYFVLRPVENAFTAELVPPNSPLIRKYFFVIHFASYMVQGMFGILVNLPTYMGSDQAKDGVMFISYALQVVLWVVMIAGYIIILVLRRGEPRNVNFGVGIASTACLYRILWVNVTNIWQWSRNHDYEVQDGFEKCFHIFNSEVLNTTKKIFKLFIIHFCLMFFHGLEMILRAMWYQQDAAMERDTFMYGFPLDVLLLISLSVFFPLVEFGVFPLFKKYARVQFDDLKLVGISNIMLAFAYMLTFLVMMLVGQDNGNDPGRDKVTLRMYNAQLYPIEWKIVSNKTDHVIIHIPLMKSRVYINDVEAVYTSTITSSFYSKRMEQSMKKGDVITLMTSKKNIIPLSSVDKELYSKPRIGRADSHLFIIPIMSTHSPIQLRTVRMNFSGLKHKTHVGDLQSKNITHLVLQGDTYTLTVTCNTNTITTEITLRDFSLHTLLLYNTLEGKLALHFDKLRSGSTRSRMLAFLQVLLTALAIAIGKVSMNTYTYRHAPSNMLGTAFSFHRFGFACSIVTFNIITLKMSLTTLGVIAFLVFFFILVFYFVIVQRDLNFEDDDDAYKQKVAKKLAIVRTRPEEVESMGI